MPRLPTSLLRQARHLNSFLPRLLRPCRELASARNELRWLLEHAICLTKNVDSTSAPNGSHQRLHQRLKQLIRQRERGTPLQYILGSQPFGDLDILCKAGVLIPRPETESITTHLASHIPKLSQPPGVPHQLFRILDLCTGTGCIPLLMHSLLSSKMRDIQLCGVDISPKATNLAVENLNHNIQHGHLGASAKEQISFVQDDIFGEGEQAWRRSTWDILISNPPYISPDAFNKTTTRSVRNFEPRTALVPHRNKSPTNDTLADHEIGDMFYPRLLHLAHQVGARVLLMEVADTAQARRVARMVIRSGHWIGYEIWRDWPAQGGHGGDKEVVEVAQRKVRVRGEGHGRAVFAWRSGGEGLVGKE